MNIRHMLMATALVGSAGLAFLADKAPEQESLLAVANTPTDVLVTAPEKKSRLGMAQDKRSIGTQGPIIFRLRERDTMERVRDDALAERDVFASRTWDPPPPKAGPPLPPQAPSLPYTYVGKKQESGEWEVYLALGEEIRVVRSNMTLDGNYQIGAITPPTLGLIYLPLKQTQTLSIGNP